MDKRPGNIAVGQTNEYQIASKFAELGFLVSWTHGNVAPYDMIVDWKGRLARVQVKVTGYRAPESLGFSVSARRNMRKGVRFTKQDCDFLVVNVRGFDCTYLIPVEAITRGNLYLHPECNPCPHTSTHRLEKYRDAFGQLM